ncbi:hypothetical protein [Flavobacterium sp.]|jgi:hypothetical protein|uniref:hypothetical protein n=1 Tax=Flavobacterium sp. TaxID=239 RepID=UPI0037C09960
MDYSEALLEVKKITQLIHQASLKRDFVLARDLSTTLVMASTELYDSLGDQIDSN